MLKVFGTHDENTIAQMEACFQAGGAHAVLCADGHKGYSQPVGGVIAYQGAVSVSGVGFDIACGNMAVKTDAKLADVQPHIETIMDDVFGQISFGVGRVNDTPIDHELFDDAAWDVMPENSKGMARQQLGTVGSGNHYVDIFVDEHGFVWVGVHFGSRGLGHKTATMYLHAAGGKDGMDVPPTLVPEESQIGQSYIR
ncbi:MAG TPA: RtcB family protein, partial [Urbifossiella sp.]|nr:RtcB family protein [Urbifossiella sp.]